MCYTFFLYKKYMQVYVNVNGLLLYKEKLPFTPIVCISIWICSHNRIIAGIKIRILILSSIIHAYPHSEHRVEVTSAEVVQLNFFVMLFSCEILGHLVRGL